jgi:FkbM family methyltransferase
MKMLTAAETRTFSALPYASQGYNPAFSPCQQYFRWARRNLLPPLESKSRLLKLVVRLTGPWPKNGIVSLDDFGIFCANFQFPTYRDLFLKGRYDPQVLWYMETLLSQDDIFLDVGANFGFFTVIGARLVGAHGRVYSFEPLQEACQYLERNIQLNSLENVTVSTVAIGASPGKAELYRFGDLPIGHTSLSPLGRSKWQSFTCDVVSLDAYVTRLDVRGVSMIKIDVEGSELNVLLGARRLLERDGPAVILEINPKTAPFFGYTPEDLLTILRDLGYAFLMYQPRSRKLAPLNTQSDLGDEGDIVCVRSEKHKSKLQPFLD